MNDDTPKGPEGDKGEVKDEIVIGDVKLTPDEAKELVESGKTYKELKEQYPDIDFKELPKSFTQTRQELAELKKPQPEPEPLEPNEIERKKQIDQLFDDPYVGEKLDKRLADREKRLKEDIEFYKVIESLESEYDGTDGRPKFDKIAVLKWGSDNNTYNPKVAYEDMHKTELKEWDLKKALEKKRPTTYFEKRHGEGGKAPDIKPATDFKSATKNALAEQE